jgi:maltokinase
MTPIFSDLTQTRQDNLTELFVNWMAHRPFMEDVGGDDVRVVEMEVLKRGRPGLVDVVAEVGGRVVHAVFGILRPGDDVHFLRSGEEVVLGVFEDDDGLGVVIDALHDAELASLLLSVVTGEDPLDEGVVLVSDNEEGTVLTFGEHRSLRVFSWLAEGNDLGVDMMVSLDDAGFNHLAAPLARWRRGGRDVGVVQELLAGSTSGWAVALTSLRDLYGSGVRPEDAGGDFGPESKALGTMTARMHLALDQVFGRRVVDLAQLLDEVEKVVRDADASLLEGASGEHVAETISKLRGVDLRLPTLRVHGDFHLGRTIRTDQGWVVADFMPGADSAGEPTFRPPLADVADMLWSLHNVAAVASLERDPTGRSGLSSLGGAWEKRNRRAFMSAYLATPGIRGLVPFDRDIAFKVVAVLELVHAAMRADRAG